MNDDFTRDMQPEPTPSDVTAETGNALNRIQEIVGFDLGHGESALARVWISGDSEPAMLELYGAKSQVTAVGKDAQGRRVLGQRALEVADVTELDISFKARPSDDLRYRRVMTDFVQAVVEHLVETHQLTLSPALRFVVGCPSGWSADTRTRYEDFIHGMGLDDVQVVRESRAAFMYAVHRNMFSVDELQDSVLVIDIGSSTTDFTLVRGMEDTPIGDSGDDIGATYLDKAIFAHTLEQQDDKAMLEAIFERAPLYRNRCEMLCRKAKESYFSHPDWYESTPYKAIEDIQGQVLFRVALDKAAMDAILARPIEALGGRSFPLALEDIVRNVYKRLETDNLMPRVVLLTGGPSRIGFIHDICEHVFAGLAPKRDSEPEYSIARGLALYGKSLIRIARFQADIETFAREHLPARIGEHLPELPYALAKPLAQALIHNALKPAQYAWRKGELDTLNDLPVAFEANAKRYLATADAQTQLNEHISAWFAPVKDDLNAETQAISQRYNVPADVLELDITYNPDDIAKSPLGQPDMGALVFGSFSVVTIVSSLVVFTLLDAFSGFLVSLPLAIVVSLIATFRGRDAANDWLRARKLPLALRRGLLSSKQIETPKASMVDKLETSIAEALQQDKDLAHNITEQVSRQLTQTLKAKADEASIFVR
ncbi:MAG: Hsp70 family protein [Deinococcota bacterium]